MHVNLFYVRSIVHCITVLSGPRWLAQLDTATIQKVQRRFIDHPNGLKYGIFLIRSLQ